MEIISSNPRFDGLHPFVRSSIQYTRLIKEKHGECWCEESKKTLGDKVTVTLDKVVPWVVSALEALDSHNHALLVGDTGLGKSLLLLQWFCNKRRYAGCVYLPCGETGFEFSAVDQNMDVAVADDVSAHYFSTHRQTLLQLFDGGVVAINPKCEAIRSLVCKAQFIFLSNFDIDSDLDRRLVRVTADRVGYVPKEERGFQRGARRGRRRFVRRRRFRRRTIRSHKKHINERLHVHLLPC
jgi:hypothetical protein